MRKIVCLLLVLCLIPLVASAETVKVTVKDKAKIPGESTIVLTSHSERIVLTAGGCSTFSSACPEGYIIGYAQVGSQLYENATSVTVNHDEIDPATPLVISFYYTAKTSSDSSDNEQSEESNEESSGRFIHDLDAISM